MEKIVTSFASLPTKTEAEFRESLVRLLPALMGFARSLTHNRPDAEDLVHDTLVKALSHFHTFTPETNLHAWLFTILRNHFLSKRRLLSVRQTIPDSDGAFAENVVVPADQDEVVYAKEFHVALEKLSEEHREIILLTQVLGLSYVEITKKLKCSVGTAKSRLFRARRALAAFGFSPTWFDV